MSVWNGTRHPSPGCRQNAADSSAEGLLQTMPSSKTACMQSQMLAAEKIKTNTAANASFLVKLVKTVAERIAMRSAMIFTKVLACCVYHFAGMYES